MAQRATAMSLLIVNSSLANGKKWCVVEGDVIFLYLKKCFCGLPTTIFRSRNARISLLPVFNGHICGGSVP
jgi:hypothetical protein